MKTCEECGVEFEPYRASRDRFCSRACNNRANSRAWRERNPERHERLGRESKLRRIGWTLDEFETAVEEQGGKCAICGDEAPVAARGRGLVPDHDHETGLRRDVLCTPCNIGLGAFFDDPDRLVAAAAYVVRHRGLSQAQDSLTADTTEEEVTTDA